MNAFIAIFVFSKIVALFNADGYGINYNLVQDTPVNIEKYDNYINDEHEIDIKGCLFADVCEPDEFCVQDGLFGHCQRDDVVRYMYSLTARDFAQLNQLLTGLSLSGATWHSHKAQEILGIFLDGLKFLPYEGGKGVEYEDDLDWGDPSDFAENLEGDDLSSISSNPIDVDDHLREFGSNESEQRVLQRELEDNHQVSKRVSPINEPEVHNLQPLIDTAATMVRKRSGATSPDIGKEDSQADQSGAVGTRPSGEEHVMLGDQESAYEDVDIGDEDGKSESVSIVPMPFNSLGDGKESGEEGESSEQFDSSPEIAASSEVASLEPAQDSSSKEIDYDSPDYLLDYILVPIPEDYLEEYAQRYDYYYPWMFSKPGDDYYYYDYYNYPTYDYGMGEKQSGAGDYDELTSANSKMGADGLNWSEEAVLGTSGSRDIEGEYPEDFEEAMEDSSEAVAPYDGVSIEPQVQTGTEDYDADDVDVFQPEFDFTEHYYNYHFDDSSSYEGPFGYEQAPTPEETSYYYYPWLWVAGYLPEYSGHDEDFGDYPFYGQFDQEGDDYLGDYWPEPNAMATSKRGVDVDNSLYNNDDWNKRIEIPLYKYYEGASDYVIPPNQEDYYPLTQDYEAQGGVESTDNQAQTDLTKTAGKGGGMRRVEYVKSAEESLRNVNQHYVFIQTKQNLTFSSGLKLLLAIQSIAGLNDTDMLYPEVGSNKLSFYLVPTASVNSTSVAHLVADQRNKIKEDLHLDVITTGIGSVDHEAVIASAYARDEKTELAIISVALLSCMAGLLVGVAGVLFFRERKKRSQKVKQLVADEPINISPDHGYHDLCKSHMAKHQQVLCKKKFERGASNSSSGEAPGSARSSTSSWSEEPASGNMDISTGHLILSYMEDHLFNKAKLQQEWDALCKYRPESRAGIEATSIVAEANVDKNRDNAALPYDHQRVRLNKDNDYINASPILDVDPKRPAYILAQCPLKSTIADFWQMVWEQGATILVLMTKLMSSDGVTELCCQFWPREGKAAYGKFEVHLVSEHMWCEDYVVRSFYLKHSPDGETRTLTLFHYLSWPQDGVPASPKQLLDFRRKVNKSYRGKSSPVIVACSLGCGRSGCYVLVDMVLSKVYKGVKEIDMAATLEHIHDQRQALENKEQFEFCLASVAEEVNAILKSLPQ